MARFTRIEVATEMYNTGIVPVFYHPDINLCKQVLKACYDGGIRVFEFTNRGDFAHEVFGELNKYAATHLPELKLGIGSVVEESTAALYIQLGANFIVSPIVQEAMARTCNRRKILWSPGCGSLSEISFAEALGAEVVKIFPGKQVGGPEFVKAIKGPFPWSSIMPTGGVEPTEKDLKTWLDAGVHCVGIGSQLFIKDSTGSYDMQAISARVAMALNIVKKHRK